MTFHTLHTTRVRLLASAFSGLFMMLGVFVMLRQPSTDFLMFRGQLSNQAPVVDAGTNQTIARSESATLDATVSDDGLPAGSTLTATWSKLSGTGVVTFGNTHSVDTVATFSQTGTYILQLSVTDSSLTTNDTVEITVGNDELNDASLLHYYPISEGTGSTLVDAISTNSLNMTVFNGATWTAGQFGTALLLNGTDQYADVDGNPSYQLSFPYTLSAWVKTTSTNTGVLISVNDLDTDTDQWGVGIRNGKAYAFGQRATKYTGSTSIDDDAWHLVTAVANSGGVMSLYVDGALESTGALVAIPSGISNISVGALQGSGGVLSFLDGAVDDVRIYNRALTASGVLNLTKLTTFTSLHITPHPSTFSGAVTMKAYVYPPTATGNVSFTESGVVLGTATLSNGSGTFLTSSLALGNHSIIAEYAGDSTYLESESIPVIQRVNKISTSTTLVSSSNPSSSGSSITFTATVSPLSSTGSFTFKDGVTVIGSGSISNGSGSYTTTSLTAGSHSITAEYSGDTIHSTSISNVVTQVVDANVPPTVDAGSGSTIYLENPATLDATATDDGLPSGSSLTVTWSKISGPGYVTFANIHAVDTTASFSATGSYVLQLHATDSVYSATDSVTINVLENLLNVPGLAHYYELNEGTGSIARDSVTTNTQTGSIRGGASYVSGKYGTAIHLGTGTGEYITASGSYQLSLPFTLSAWMKTSMTTTGVVLSVNQTDSTTRQWGIGVSNSRAYSFGPRTTHIGGVNDVDDDEWHLVTASASTGGVISLFVDGVRESTGSIVALPAGITTIVIGGMQGNVSDGTGTGTILHHFTGDIDDVRLYNRALSIGDVYTLARSSTTTAMSNTPNPSVVGAAVTFKAFVTPSNASGTVTFYEGLTAIGSGTLLNGTGTFITSSLTQGTHTIYAVYGGNDEYNGSVTPVSVTQVVNLSTSTTTLVASPNPSMVGSGVTFTATVSPSNATGSVIFKDGPVQIGSAVLGNGSGSFVTTSLIAGSHTMTAVYSGNVLYSTSTSNAVTQVVNASSSSSSSSAGGTSGGGGGGGGGGGRGSGYRNPATQGTKTTTSTSSKASTILPFLGTTPVEPVTFFDVAEDAWYAPFIGDLANRRIITGYKDDAGRPLNLFKPEAHVNLVEVLKMSIRSAGKPVGMPTNSPFTSIAWYTPYILKGRDLNLSMVNSDNFIPERNATRGEVIQALFQTFGIPLSNADPTIYKDLPASSPYAQYITTATQMGIMIGDIGPNGEILRTVRPNDPVNRAEVSKMISILLALLGR